MDKKNISLKIKKYLFFISIVFLIFTSIHLIYSYIYNNSKEIPKKGGTISEAIIWKFPHLNPLKTDNNYNDYINHILYRSLLIYNSKDEKIEWDISNCDISNLLKIECFINDGTTWSDWTKITPEDIILTYTKIKETNVNPILKSILSEVTIEKTQSSVVFKSNKKDINILNIFFQPIVSTKVLSILNNENIESNFSPLNGIYSWKYIITKVDQDEISGITKIILDKNQFYTKNPAYIDKMILKIFNDNNHFLKNKDSVQIFNDKENLVWDSVPKLNAYKYHLPQYISLFINYETVPYPNIRNNILTAINNKDLVEELWENNFKTINSPFLNDLNLDLKNSSETIPSLLESLWYLSKNKAIEKYWSNTNIQQNKQKSIQENNTQKINITKDNYLKKSILVYSPDWVDNYNYTSKDKILLKAKVNPWVQAVYVNDYKIENFKQWDTDFAYKLSSSYGTLKNWRNNYNIFFETNGVKTQVETIVFYYNIDREKAENEVLTTLINRQLEENKKLAEENTKKIEEEKKKLAEKETEQQTIKDKIKKLDSNFYYNSNLTPFTLKLAYITNSESLEKTALFIKEKLEKQGIKVETNWLTLKELSTQLASSNKSYDLFVTWINLWYSSFNLFPYLHSSQIKNGYNFTKFKNLHLDKILEDIKSNNFDKRKLKNEEEKIIYNLNKEFIMKPLYTPLYSNLVDKSIDSYYVNSVIPNDIYRFDPLISSYIAKEKILDNSWKWFIWFFKYLISTLF